VGKEWLMLIKSKSADYKRIEKEIVRLHNYELPEIIQVPITTGSSGYLKWIDESTKAAK
jgi:periplasmic divalent cation tolerance protein